MPKIALGPIPTHPSDFACIDLVNSLFTDHLGRGGRTDRIDTREWREWFTARHDLTPDVRGTAPIDELRALRRDLRRILEKWSTGVRLSSRDQQTLDTWVAAPQLRQRVVRAGSGVELRLEPVRRDWSWAIGRVAASAVELMSAGASNRFKACSNPDCSWVFYDTTINGSKRYCSTTQCGSLIRVRRFRHRH